MHNYTFSLIILISIMFLLFLLSYFFSSSETAITSINVIRLKQMAKLKSKNKNKKQLKRVKRVYSLVKDYDRTLATILIANTLINTSLATVGTLFFSIIFKNKITVTWIATGVIGCIVLIFCEIIPKMIAKKIPEKFSIFASYILFFWKILFYPFTWFINIKNKKRNNIIYATENELLELISTIESEGVIEKNEQKLIESAIIFDEKNIESIMKYKDKVQFVYDDINWNDLKNIYIKQRFTRMPVIEKKTNKIIGILNIKDVLIALIEKKEIKISELKTEPFYINKNIKLDLALELFQQKQIHLGIVINNNNNINNNNYHKDNYLGIVTLEDIIEELVGEIYDEDDKTGQIKFIGHHMFWVNGSMPLKKVFKKYLKLTPPEKSEKKTLYEWYKNQIDIKYSKKSKLFIKNNFNSGFIYNNFSFKINNDNNEKNNFNSSKKKIIEIEILTDINFKDKI